MKRHHRIHMKNAFLWRYPEAPLELARAFGQIAADLWAAGRLRLTGTHTVATLGPDEAPDTNREDRDDQVPGDRGGSETVA